MTFGDSHASKDLNFKRACSVYTGPSQIPLVTRHSDPGPHDKQLKLNQTHNVVKRCDFGFYNLRIKKAPFATYMAQHFAVLRLATRGCVGSVHCSKTRKYGRGVYSYVLHAIAVRPLTTRPREDGALFPQDRSPTANRSFLLRQRWLKNIFRCLCILSTSLPAFSTPSHAPVQQRLHLPCLKHLPVLSFFFSQLSHEHFPLLLVRYSATT
ncbi:unnamed protein product [Ectocarpus sp. 12 AP-2014]